MSAALHRLDARRLLCPLPVIRVQALVEGLAPGERVAVTCTDPGARHDIPAWCRVHGHRLIGIEDGEHEFVLTLEVGGRGGG